MEWSRLILSGVADRLMPLQWSFLLVVVLFLFCFVIIISIWKFHFTKKKKNHAKPLKMIKMCHYRYLYRHSPYMFMTLTFAELLLRMHITLTVFKDHFHWKKKRLTNSFSTSSCTPPFIISPIYFRVDQRQMRRFLYNTSSLSLKRIISYKEVIFWGPLSPSTLINEVIRSIS